jgi:ACS family hexuronate transporter-like MFS transporter
MSIEATTTQCTPTPAELASIADTPGGHFRWSIVALIFFATTINYMDRQVLGILAPLLGKTIGWNEQQYGYIVCAFQGAYAIGLLFAGAIIDRIGTRAGYALSIGTWSVAAMGHALAGSVPGFGIARALLGLGESGNFPAAIKTIAEWFPRRERALATGIFNSGTNLGAIIAPLTVPWVTEHWGWRWAFVFTGIFSMAWLLTWLAIYRRPEDHPKLSPGELAWIRSDAIEPTVRIPWARLLRHQQTWAFIVVKFMTDPIWWFYLFWLPKFLNSTQGLTLTKLGPPLVVIYLAADVGSIGGGWLSSRLLKRGWTPNRARKTAMFICACCVVPVISAAKLHGLWPVVTVVSLATAGHQGWSCNLFTTASDMFPRRAVGSVVGLGGFGGALGGMLIAGFAGWLLQLTHSYVPLFAIAGSAYLLALIVLQAMAPRLEPANIEESLS